MPKAPQLEVLKMADVFVTHGGMNSVSEALFFGTPMVVIPFVSDQPVNAKCVEKLGVGKTLEYAHTNKKSIKHAVFDLLFDKNIPKNIENVQELIAKAPGNRGGAEMIIQYYQKCDSLNTVP